MPRKPKTQPAELPAIPQELLAQFGNGPMTSEAIHAASLAFKKALIERALGGELNHHLGYSPGAAKPATVTNQRNGTGGKTILTEDGPIRIEVPRDREHIKKAKVDGFGFYDLKGKGATDMWLAGVPLEQIQVLCGHESVKTTEVYVKCRWRGTVKPNQVVV